MAGYFNKLRKKPRHVRDNIAFSIAGGFTLTVALAWFFIGFTGFGGSTEITAEEKPKAFSTLIDQIQDQVASAREGVSEAKKENASSTVSNGEWGLSAQNSSSSNNLMPKEASLMIVGASSTQRATSTAATTSVLY
jgi:hypothetical protein